MDEIKNILDLNEQEARDFFLRPESYANFELPIYFTFEKLLNKVHKKIDGKVFKNFRKASKTPREFDGVNHHLLSNKDGKYSWRPLQLINPAIYVSLVHQITKQSSWEVIKNKFKEFQNNNKLECHSLPVVSTSDDTDGKSMQIMTWWQQVEQKSISLSLDFKYVLHTDISDCYSSIYTHSIPWALHTKVVAKKRENRTNECLIGVVIDNHLQDMSFGQTNGIPQGSILMDFIAEIVLGYVDLLLSKKISELTITDYKIQRYRDDYRIFTNNPFEAEVITRELSKILSGLGMKLNADKTIASKDIIKSSIKADKRYWIENQRKTDNKQKWLIQIYLLSEVFPNSGTIDTQMRDFLKVLKISKKKHSDLEVLISLATAIAIRNPRVVPTAIAILSIFISMIKKQQDKEQIIQKIRTKFKLVPNSTFFMIWFQRLHIKINTAEKCELSLCKKLNDSTIKIWNTDWINGDLKTIIDTTAIVKKTKLKKARSKLSKEEINKLLLKRIFYA